MHSIIYKVLLFILGTVFGSFINVLSIRYVDMGKIFDFKVIGGRSKCVKCLSSISWFDLVPILSFVFLRAKCRSCNSKISFQYPIVEIASGLIFAFVPSVVSSVYQFAYRIGGLGTIFYVLSAIYILFALILLFIALVDLRLQIIPDQSNILIAFLGVFLIFIKRKYEFFDFYRYSFLSHYASLFGFRDNLIVNHILAFAVGLISFGLIYFLSRGRGMGFGDVKLAAVLGFFLGWPDIVIVLALSFIIGSFWSIILMFLGKAKMKSLLPFGPFIVLAVFVVVFFGRELLNFYFSLFPFN